jgi:hypothetical protein
MTARPGNNAALAARMMELGFAVPQVVAHRLMRIAAAGPRPSSDDWNELWLMGAEKIVAYAESCNAMALEVLRANWAFALSFGPGWWFSFPLSARSSRARTRRHIERTALAAFAKGMAPIHRRAVANAKRLGRPRLK